MNTIIREPESGFSRDACRKRLQAITTDAAALDSFERVARSGDMAQEFLEATPRLNVSLDYVSVGDGEPVMAEASSTPAPA